MHEFHLIKRYFSQIAKTNTSALNLNDDVFFDRQKGIIISIDTYNIFSHFLDFKSPDLVIKKILRSSISDLICKGVNPKFFFISGSGNKKTFTKKNLKKISKSLKSEQKKYKMLLSGGDTTFSNKLTFTIASLGYSKKIVYRNRAKLNDDIYVTGNLGDSYIGLQILKKKLVTDKISSKFFTKKYYQPELKLKFTQELLKIANTSIDISDGLIADMDKMINIQNLSYYIYEDQIPISANLKKLIKSQNLNKINLVSNGDDYEILFTANPKKSRIIQNISRNKRIKISKIGKIISGKNKSLIINKKGKQILAKNKGYFHCF